MIGGQLALSWGQEGFGGGEAIKERTEGKIEECR